MAVKVPPLLHKMSKASQEAWYKKHGMEMPKAAEGGRSAAQAKKDVGEINKQKARTAAIASAAASKKNKELVSSSERVRQMAQRRREGGEGLGGGLETNRDIISYVRAGGTIKAGRLGEATRLDLVKRAAAKNRMGAGTFLSKVNARAAQISASAKDDAEDVIRKEKDTHPLTRALTFSSGSENDSWHAKLSKRLGISEEVQQIDEANPENKAKKKEFVRQVGLKAMAAGKVDPARGHIPQRAGREELRKEGFDPSSEEIAKMLVDKHGKNVTKDHIKDLEDSRDSHSGLDHEEIMKHVKKMTEETKQEAEKLLGGPVKPKTGNIPAGKLPYGFRRARNLARQAMKAGKPVTESTTEVEVNEMSRGKALAKMIMAKQSKHPIAQHMGEAADDSREYDYEGDMAKSQLKSIITNAQRLHDSLDDDTNLPEWVQLKITLAEDYVVTAANYMEGELDESVEIDEAHMTDAQMKRREHLVKSMKSADWEKRYPGRGEKVMYATATKMAMKEEAEQIDEDHEDDYAKHMEKHVNASEKGDWDKAETHAQRAENAAAKHFKATGKKVYDPGYTGSSKHITTVKEEVEQVDEKYMGFKAVMAAAKKGGARDPAAVAAAIGRKKYGKEKFQAMAAAGKRHANEEVEQVAEDSEGSVPTTPKEKELAAHHGDPNRITYGDVIKARLKAAAKKGK